MIKPTIGRVVLVARSVVPSDKREPAFVCHVFHDRMINVGGFDSNGDPFKLTSLPLLQDDDTPPISGPYAEWMPYQKGVAAGVRTPNVHAGPKAD